ncbi:ATP-binding protein [Vagococcus salmoninarum]
MKITDFGQGIPQNIQDNMFKRGFSTKGDNRGYGLNLIHRILTDHDGLIEVKTQADLGTTFYIELPYEREELK